MSEKLKMKSEKLKMPTLRFKEFNGEWEEKKLGNMLSFKNGINADKEQYGTGYKFINVLDIINNNTVTHNDIIGSVNVSKEIFAKNRVEYGDILFQRCSEIREEAGQSNVYLDKDNYSTFGGFVIRGQKKVEYIPEFMNYMFKTSHARKEITQKSNGSTRYNVGQDTLSKVIVFIPNLLEQEKIASFLSSIDKKIEQLSKKDELLHSYKKGAMQKIFSQEIRFSPKGTSSEVQGEDDGNNYPDWEERKLEDFLNITLREVPKPNVNYLAIGIRSHCKGTFQKPNSEPHKIAMDKLYQVKKNDLIVSITFAWESAIAIVKKEDENGLVSHRFPTYTFNNSLVIVDFFRYVIIQKRFRFMLELISPGGAGRNRVMSKKEFMKLNWNMPCVEEQTKIANFLSSIDTKISQNKKALEETKKFKKALLQKMFV